MFVWRSGTHCLVSHLHLGVGNRNQVGAPSRNGALATGGCGHSPELGERNLPTSLPELRPSQLGEEWTGPGRPGQGRTGGTRWSLGSCGAGPDHSWLQDQVRTTRARCGCPPPRPQPGCLLLPVSPGPPPPAQCGLLSAPGLRPEPPRHPAGPGVLRGDSCDCLVGISFRSRSPLEAPRGSAEFRGNCRLAENKIRYVRPNLL